MHEQLEKTVDHIAKTVDHIAKSVTDGHCTYNWFWYIALQPWN